ncbi:MAG TPA: hypothetical protein DEG17_12535 [Cyanobacteria bacterium UBA11149]|nr:hypothetical protein [Cyanobacteria bacterium UBA11367]HBE60349.1 hypothetical protein [Cyanobacteria bacterium UBA11366]HBK66639.1 hypothetical protein [Cyanobacteria bacterium UBA11166]HBR75409.1 hypothetical protein [Cyanobacteria bacterium UBA11159]HBS71853.1 hypothetical protein [Cyanobacteria bacterium UBA11153]HBW89673.1 hypothetical protein [Cyanobacteria bacterium UBA11149]HCA97049.1 hypothetical protein [Cyanobacteria bacterium UBA9226]
MKSWLRLRKSLNGNSSQTSAGSEIPIAQLWREFLPLSLSDVTMACGDPLITTTLAHLPDARNSLASVGIAKALAVFFESPIMMILHASNVLAPTQASRKALWQFVLLSGGGLSLLLTLLGLPIVFEGWADRILGVPRELSPLVGQVLLLMGVWPFAIAWRRYFQGLLIHTGHPRAVAQASLLRLGAVGLILMTGFILRLPGAILAGLALIMGVLVEAIAVTVAARQRGALKPPSHESLAQPIATLPTTLPQVWKFYYPLANSMLVVWGGRALLISIIARAEDASLAIASWSAGWGLVLAIANSTRMVQQVIIKYRGKVSDRRLLIFALTVGGISSSLLLLMSITGIGDQMIQSFIGSDRALVDRIKPVLLICSGIPLLVALQNATQGFLVGEGRTGTLYLATWIGTGGLLAVATIAVQSGMSGAMAAAIAMVVAMLVEVFCLLLKRKGFGTKLLR